VGGLALSRRDVFRSKQPSGYVDAPGPSNAHAASGARSGGLATRRDVGTEEAERQSTDLELLLLPPPTRCHATDTTENCGGAVLHVTSGIPLAVIMAWYGGTRRPISGQMPLISLGGQICTRTLGLEKSVESDGLKGHICGVGCNLAGD